MFELRTWAPLFFTAGLLFVTLNYSPNLSRFTRAFAAIICSAAFLRYLYWRIFFTLPVDQNFLQQTWAVAFLVMEVSAVLSAMLVHFFMSRYLDRRAQADASQSSPLLQAPVDVFIATLNEDISILERTIVGAQAICHNNLRIWILDDGARPAVRQLADELGVRYAQRVKGKHAKAGNINNGLQQALSTGRPPEFILLLDADFVPFRNILQRTLGFFEDPGVGIV